MTVIRLGQVKHILITSVSNSFIALSSHHYYLRQIHDSLMAYLSILSGSIDAIAAAAAAIV